MRGRVFRWVLRRHYFLRNLVSNLPRYKVSRPSRTESQTKLWQPSNRGKHRLSRDLPSSLLLCLKDHKSIFLDLKSVMDISKFLPVYTASVDRDSSVGIATHYRLEVAGIETLWTRNFPHTSRTALGLIQPPIQEVTGLSRGKADGTWHWSPTLSSVEIK
jgi:hypothetical protein